MTKSNNNIELPYVPVHHSIHPVDELCKQIIQSKRTNPSDLSEIIIWCESQSSIHAIKLKLLAHAKDSGINSLLFPTIITLQDWVWQQQSPDKQLISETNKQLLLVEAIRQSPGLFQTNNAWPLAKELITLFNECTLAQIPLDDGEDAFRSSLIKSYNFTSTTLSNISRESEIVYKLWQAYCEQISARKWMDPIHHYAQWLTQTKNIDASKQYYMVGVHRLALSEKIFLHHVSTQTHLSIFIPEISDNEYGSHHHPHLNHLNNTPTTSDKSFKVQALKLIYQKSQHAFDKIKAFKNLFDKNIFIDWLSTYTCSSAEAHAEGVCLQAKKWLLENKYPIGIIINDRLLARRIRAVFEKEGIYPYDLGGWTISTTSAASSIEILLDCIESNFKKENLIDLLNSPFLPENNSDSSTYKLQLNDAQQIFANHRNTHKDEINTFINLINHYSSHDEISFSDLIATIERIKDACDPLCPSLLNNEYVLSDLSDHLLQLLDKIGIKECLLTDTAGQQLLEVFEAQINSSRNNNIKINWKEWRQWIKDIFENNYFTPDNTDQRITLCGFEHTDNLTFKSAIIAGSEESRMLSSRSHRTFFNEKVRHELGLSTSHEHNAINFIRFRQLLSQSDEILFTAETETHGEPIEICSWVKMIELFSTQAYSHPLENQDLHFLVEQRSISQINELTDSTNKLQAPSPSSPESLIPTRISATQYQSLIDCPYQFFAKYILQLSDHTLNEELDASEYGKLVHQSLYEFHFDENNKTGLTFITSNRDQLINTLKLLSQKIFTRAIFPATIKEGWLQRWVTNIPDYIDWAIDRSSEWKLLRGEYTLEYELNPKVTLYGQVDRIDSNNREHAVVDYKTGSSKPSGKKVLNGEIVQLPFYAFLDEKITQAEYLSLGSQREVKSVALLNESELTELKAQHASRINQLFSKISNNAPLIANGEDAICSYCDYEGLCRKSHWS